MEKKLVVGKVTPLGDYKPCKEVKVQAIDEKFIVKVVEETNKNLVKTRLDDLIAERVKEEIGDLKEEICSDVEDNVSSEIMSSVEDMIDEKLEESKSESDLDEVKDVLNAIKDAIVI